jgi:hypothetical protein
VDRSGGKLIEIFGHLDGQRSWMQGKQALLQRSKSKRNKLWQADELNGIVLISMKKMSVSGDRPCLC